MNPIIDLANDALCAIASVQLFCAENDCNIAVYALNSAHNDIDAIKQMVERNEVITRSKVAAYAEWFEKYHDQCEPFTAEQFLIDFDEFNKFEGDENGN